MKKGTPDHPKTVDLSERLKLNRAWACGILELLWSFTRDYAPEGDIGRFSDAAIARATHWHKAPAILIAALVELRWLNTCPVHRLSIHDWPDHCDEYTRKKLKRSGSDFTQCCTKSGPCPDKVQTISDIESRQFQPRARALPVPVPVPEPVPAIVQTAGTDPSGLNANGMVTDPGGDLCAIFEREFKGEWLPDTWRVFPSHVTASNARAFEANMPLWMKTRKYIDGFGQNSVKFLASQVWLKPPPNNMLAPQWRESDNGGGTVYRDHVPLAMQPRKPGEELPTPEETAEFERTLREKMRAKERG